MIKSQIIVNGNGSEITDSKVLKGRAKRKMITQNMVLNLIDVAQGNREYERVKSFWNTYYCQNKIHSSDGRLYGKYCKNRFCTLCCSIRKAVILNKYLPIIKQWENPYFVTLTVKAVPARILKQRIKNLLRAFRIIINRYRKQNQRGKGLKLVGVKSLECNFNPMMKTYNPHLHIIVPNKQIANILIREWLLLWTKEFASKLAQHSRKVNSAEKDLIEIVKYGSKIFTEPDINKKSKEKSSPLIYISALNNILNAMKGHRVFERFGFNLTTENKLTNAGPKVLNQYNEWVFDLKQTDWVNTDSEELLSGYLPTNELKGLLKNNIDIHLE
jgi:plasmid rolling circle replication initiator protein Rep